MKRLDCTPGADVTRLAFVMYDGRWARQMLEAERCLLLADQAEISERIQGIDGVLRSYAQCERHDRRAK